jgi:hypothetical protein
MYDVKIMTLIIRFEQVAKCILQDRHCAQIHRRADNGAFVVFNEVLDTLSPVVAET